MSADKHAVRRELSASMARRGLGASCSSDACAEILRALAKLLARQAAAEAHAAPGTEAQCLARKSA